jgi:hypothetical protein
VAKANGLSAKEQATLDKLNAKLAASQPDKASKQAVELSDAMLKLGQTIWAWWTSKAQPWAALGIRQKTAIASPKGTRSAMLAVAAYGYKQGEALVLVQATRLAGFGVSPSVGGISMPYFEKLANIQEVTPIAAIRPDAKDGKMRLMPLTGTGKARTVAAQRAPQPTAERKNGEVKVVRKSDKALAEDKAERAARRAANRAKQAAQGKATTPRLSDAELAAKVAAENDIAEMNANDPAVS